MTQEGSGRSGLARRRPPGSSHRDRTTQNSRIFWDRHHQIEQIFPPRTSEDNWRCVFNLQHLLCLIYKSCGALNRRGVRHFSFENGTHRGFFPMQFRNRRTIGVAWKGLPPGETALPAKTPFSMSKILRSMSPCKFNGIFAFLNLLGWKKALSRDFLCIPFVWCGWVCFSRSGGLWATRKHLQSPDPKKGEIARYFLIHNPHFSHRRFGTACAWWRH